jgi:hypothetical protein
LNQLRDTHLFVEMDRVQRCVLGDAFAVCGHVVDTRNRSVRDQAPGRLSLST